VSRLSRQCGILNISQPYSPPRPVTRIALLYFLLHPSFHFIIQHPLVIGRCIIWVSDSLVKSYTNWVAAFRKLGPPLRSLTRVFVNWVMYRRSRCYGYVRLAFVSCCVVYSPCSPSLVPGTTSLASPLLHIRTIRNETLPRYLRYACIAGFSAAQAAPLYGGANLIHKGGMAVKVWKGRRTNMRNQWFPVDFSAGISTCVM
jgi:hypothetical protein